MKSSIRCLSKASCCSLALVLVSASLLHAGAITSVAAFTGSTVVIPFTGDGFLDNAGVFYPNDTLVSPPAINQGFKGNFGGLPQINANAMGRLYNYYDYITDISDNATVDNDTVNTEVVFRDVSLDTISSHTDLSIFSTTQFDNFATPFPASLGEALLLTSPINAPAQLQLTFAQTVQRIGMFFAGNAGGNQSFYTLDAFDINDVLLGSSTVGDTLVSGNYKSAFIGWESLVIPIARIVVRETNASGNPVNNSSSPLFDDVRYEIFEVTQPPVDPIEIPEPSTLLLASLGLLGFAARRRRQSC